MLTNEIIYNCKTGEITFNEIEVPDIAKELPIPKGLTLEEKVELLEDENKKIKEVNNTQDILIDTTMMATDEVFMMLEPILEMMPMTMSIDGEMKGGSSKMVDMYVAMVQRGLKTIEQVPTRYREEVARILSELEK